MQSSILDLVNGQLDQNTVSSISRRIGADPGTTKDALSTALPLLLAALAGNAQNEEGAQSLQQALMRDHDGSVLNDVSSVVKEPARANGAGILRHTLGKRRPVVEQAVSAKTGLDAGAVGQILEIAAPLLMGALGLTARQDGLNASGLASLLGGQQQAVQQQVEQAQPDLMGLLGGLLGGQGGQADALGSLLGGLLGGTAGDEQTGGGFGNEQDDRGDQGGGLLGKLFGGR